MGAFLHGVADRNSAVRKAYASALGHLVRVSRTPEDKTIAIKDHYCMHINDTAAVLSIFWLITAENWIHIAKSGFQFHKRLFNVYLRSESQRNETSDTILTRPYA